MVGNVIVVESVPSNVNVLLTVAVFPLTIESKPGNVSAVPEKTGFVGIENVTAPVAALTVI